MYAIGYIFAILFFVWLFVLVPIKLYVWNQNKKRQNQTVVPTLICPTCHVKAVERVPVSGKVGSAALVGVFAIPKIGKSFRCTNCGYAW